MTQPTLESRKVTSKSAEREMRRWAMGIEVQEKIAQQPATERLHESIHPYIAISRDSGAGAGEIAKRVGEQLGWDVLGKELLTQMADDYHLERVLVESVDETTSSLLLDTFGKWLDDRVVTGSQYATRLGRIVLMAVHHQSAVFVGRGAQFFLPRERGLNVQIVAPLKQRIERVMQRDNLTRDDARRQIEQTDRARRDFIRERFLRDVTDPHLYDLVINLEHLNIDDAVELIVGQCRRRFGV